MKLVENFSSVSDICNNSATTNFGNSIVSQLAGMIGLSSVAKKSGLDEQSKLIEKVQEVRSRLQTVKWQCSQKIFLTQDQNNDERVKVLTELQNYLDETTQYIYTKYMFKAERLGILDGAISVLTFLVVFVILYFLKFN